MITTQNGDRDRYWLRVLLPAITIPLCVLVLWFLGAGLARAQDRLVEHDKGLARHETLLEVIDKRLSRIEDGLESLGTKVDKLKDAVLRWGPREKEQNR